MAGGLVGLLDDVAALARLAAASIDDVGAAAGRASAKAAGVVVDDTAVTPAYVRGLAADRELPIVKRIAKGSLRNKLLFIVPAALILSAVAPLLVELILIAGGMFLCYEGFHKIHHAIKGDDHDHDVPAAVKGPEAEEETVAGAIRTDFILSAEIMVISLKEVLEESFALRAVVLVVVAVMITAVVYGIVALIVRMDDVGLSLAERDAESSQRIGRMLVNAMPKVLTFLSVIGTAAMLWVGGHIILAGTHELGWDGLYDIVHDLEESVNGVGGIGGLLGWLVNTALSAVIGIVVGGIVSMVLSVLPFGPGAKNNDTDKGQTAGAH
jgi:predicted DNA repair protein MutK